MDDCMEFPNDWAKFLEDYSFRDHNEFYTNGARLIPTFRVEQMMHHYLRKAAEDAPAVDEMREFSQDVAYQFGYYFQNGGRLHITHGGLSTLEQAFDILGWENPHPVPECECEIEGCHEHATCGAPTADGYKRMCGRHCRERKDNERKAY